MSSSSTRWWYHTLTAHQHQKGHTVPKQVIMIATSIQVATVHVLHCVRAIRYQAKSEQNVQYLIPRVRHGEAALIPPPPPVYKDDDTDINYLVKQGTYFCNILHANRFIWYASIP